MAPTARQVDFLTLDCEEALYGGAAGGGKSEALLLWLAEGIHIPEYSGIIFRRTYKQLTKSNDSLIAKSFRLYKPLGGEWNGTRMQWRFPGGAMVEMGALENANSVYDYQGPAFHRVAYDELTQFLEEQYLYLFSRIRAGYFPIPMGMRASANPGGIGHAWVFSRFLTLAALEMLRTFNYRQPSPPESVFWSASDRSFVPARLADNPYIDFEKYLKSLMHLPVVLRERLLNGDWSILEDALIKESWFRYYDMQGQYLRLYDATGKQICHCDERDCRQRVMTIDTAGTSEDKVKESKGKSPSWSVAQTWDYLPSQFGRRIALRDVWRKRVGYPELREGVEAVAKAWRPGRILIEDKHFGPALASDLRRDGLPASTVATGQKDKVTRATDLLNMLEAGEVFLPEDSVPGVGAWLPALVSEWLSWQGLEDETADQIDTAAYAALEAVKGGGRVVKLAVDPRKAG